MSDPSEDPLFTDAMITLVCRLRPVAREDVPIITQAVRWIAWLGDADRRDETAAFKAWIENPKHVAALHEMYHMQKTISELSEEQWQEIHAHPQPGAQ